MKINHLSRGLYTTALFSLMLVSCNKETKQAEETTVTATTPAATDNTLAPDAAAAPVEPATAAVPAPQAAPATATAPGMNPPHGQPGHRCEIPVGAPLNSAPQQKAGAATVQPAPQSFMQQQPQQQQAQQAQTAPAATPPGMNPPHGQPGHTCSVPVGAPLPGK